MGVHRPLGLAFVAVFFIYLFGPLVLMGITAFNSSAFPRVSPWECFTVEWFQVLVNDQRLMEGLRNSVLIGLGVVLLAVPLGLAGALLLTQIPERVRPWYYTVVISPILVPGVVLGISTLIFWDRLGTLFGASHESIFYSGFFLTVVGQSTFIAAYTMLVFISRLQRFDPALEEAALDLGASQWQAFRKILLPFLKPAIFSAAVLAFLASFENYNTTVFTIVSESTLTTVLASKVRYGIDPSISALAVTIVLITVFAACLHELSERRKTALLQAENAVARANDGGTHADRPAKPPRGFFAQPALYMIVAVFLAGLATAYFAGTVGVAECKRVVQEDKQRRIQERIEALRAQRQRQHQENAGEAASSQPPPPAPRSEPGGVFAPGNLRPQEEPESESESESESEPAGGVFAPGNLRPDG